ncbi:hypothetical protein [Azospirillum doebereinerae]
MGRKPGVDHRTGWGGRRKHPIKAVQRKPRQATSWTGRRAGQVFPKSYPRQEHGPQGGTAKRFDVTVTALGAEAAPRTIRNFASTIPTAGAYLPLH